MTVGATQVRDRSVHEREVAEDVGGLRAALVSSVSILVSPCGCPRDADHILA
jgi:hypothetical protein